MVVRGVLACLALLGLVAAAPVAEMGATSDVALLEVETAAKDNITISCPLCVTALSTLLDFCKEFDGYSVPRVADYVSKCSLIGEVELKRQDRANGCSNTTIVLRSRARVWNRKLKCLKIYTALSETYTPFDPCTQIRTVVEKEALAPCNANPIRCVPPPVDFEETTMPPWVVNASLPNELPPLSCPQYVSQLDAECKTIKDDDFYARSNLDAFCDSHFLGNVHQINACNDVRNRMFSIDSHMDLCGSLHAVPIAVTPSKFCTATLGLPALDPVPSASYSAYLERVRLLKEAWNPPHMAEVLPASADAQFPPGDVVVDMVPPTHAKSFVAVQSDK